ncbi:GDPmannose 4,6-dehydratase [Pseudobutyrivibrio sp. NOR37]|uniref:GDP-mannose 4,6-dehydratase n=1 Tax=Pseudobutyrivibrio xylanivorans TaxID=185007 RepID=A0A6M0LJG8_PSEXY|nr:MULTISPECIES: GDP-mannose 4,6-dehydratase [Pseudobutyrivibrio]NEX02300.1 GDP-mannose 4,6-dehydratase [Pseudobutyrivibrio xylanivorans]SFR77899.1 GDPmannose 4,6-dehydratase [Pseudobutyrivibrio sp. NOR37]
MKSLVIGGAGFVGAYLVRHLKNDLGQDVVVTKMEHESLDIDGIDMNSIEIENLNILNEDEIVELFNKDRPDYIFHLAAQSSVSVSWKNPKLTVDVNIKGAVNLLEALRKIDFKPRTLIIGSGEEYGHIRANETPITEDNNTRPGNIYAATKACQNMLGKIYADAYGLDVVMVRAFNHIGPNQTPLFVVADFCQQVAMIEAGKQEPVIRVGNLSAARDFTDVRDVVRAYAMLVEKGESGETYNVGSGKAVVIDDILRMILKNSTKEIKVEVDTNKLRPVDVPIIEADITKLQQATGWAKEIELERTIRETLDYWRVKV